MHSVANLDFIVPFSPSDRKVFDFQSTFALANLLQAKMTNAFAWRTAPKLKHASGPAQMPANSVTALDLMMFGRFHLAKNNFDFIVNLLMQTSFRLAFERKMFRNSKMGQRPPVCLSGAAEAKP
jgi:hypothetical protein